MQSIIWYDSTLNYNTTITNNAKHHEHSASFIRKQYKPRLRRGSWEETIHSIEYWGRGKENYYRMQLYFRIKVKTFFFLFRLVRNAYIRFCSVQQWLWLWLFYKSRLKLGCLELVHCAQCIYAWLFLLWLPFSLLVGFVLNEHQILFLWCQQKKFIWNSIDNEKKKKQN